MKHWPPRRKSSMGAAEVIFRATLVPAVLLAIGACTREAEPRWLLRALPGKYPEIVYFVPTTSPAVAMTIDDGLDPETTPLILETLKAHGASATFFVLSDSIAGREVLLQRVLYDGHEIGHHMTEDEVTVSLKPDAMAEKFHRAATTLDAFAPITWFRPGSGRYNDAVLELTRARGYRIALASVAPLDTVIHNPVRMAGFVDRMVEPGSVVVLHDVGHRGRRTVEILEILLPKLKERGYAVVSLSRLDALAGLDKKASKE
ncbi:MAG: polysaccharide deacetylase family protein [Pseudomonadales bacterium]|nr:polysaccharide deacetylase family protein [Pseudomonadales bacterium]NIX07693.1 polysaccharide deacetylase family protein [Pseudomonadales bacterium]